MGKMPTSNGHNVLSSDHMAPSEESTSLQKWRKTAMGILPPSNGHSALSIAIIWPLRKSQYVLQKWRKNSNGQNAPLERSKLPIRRGKMPVLIQRVLQRIKQRLQKKSTARDARGTGRVCVYVRGGA